MAAVLIGADPHKRSVTIEARDDREVLRATATLPTTTAGYRQLRRFAEQWPVRVWAVEGANGAGKPLAQRLLADGERVLDVPAKLAARVRVFDTGHGRKTDATDAHAIVMAALRDRDGLRELVFDEQLVVLRLLCDRRDELSRARTQGLNRLHRLLAELIPGGVPAKKSVAQHQAMLTAVRPRDQVGRTLRRLAADLLADLVRLDGRLKVLTRDLRNRVVASGSGLMDIFGVGPAGAARILADVGDVARFPDRAHFASWTGTAPLDASSGEQVRHRLSRAGNRRLNHVLHIAAVVQLRHDTEGRAYYRRKRAAGKTPLEALRCLKRRLSDVVYRQLAADAQPAPQPVEAAGPGGHGGATVTSSAADLPPHIGTSDKPLPGPAPATLPTRPTTSTPRAGLDSRRTRRRAGGVKVERPTGRTTLTPTSAGAS